MHDESPSIKKEPSGCLVIGDLMFDVFSNVTKPASPLVYGGTSYLSYGKIDFGGAGNVAAGISLLGEKASLIGKVGCDFYGMLYQNDLIRRGVIARVFFEEDISTGFNLVTLDKKGERSFSVFRGANDMLSADEIDSSIELLNDSRYLYVSGYSLVANPVRAAILHSVEKAKEHHKKVIFDPGAYNIIKSHFSEVLQLLDLCDVFCANLDEAKAITQASLAETVSKLRSKNRLTAIKCGSRGSILINKEKTLKIPGFKVACLDSTGAGDAFAAALIYGLLRNLPLHDVGQLANWFAAQVTTRIGARSFPSRTEVENFLKHLTRKD